LREALSREALDRFRKIGKTNFEGYKPSQPRSTAMVRFSDIGECGPPQPSTMNGLGDFA